jgi:hypothetical protein
VSKQDTHFFNTFSLVIGLLVAIAISIFAFARVVASQTQDKDVYEETQYLRTVRQNLAPIAQVAVAGRTTPPWRSSRIRPPPPVRGRARPCPPPARGCSRRPAAPAMGQASRVRRRRETKQRGVLESPRARTPCISTL